MTSHRCIQRSQRTQLKKHLFGERESEKGRKTMRERELARMCVWDDARDEKCLTPGESDVPERMSWEKWRLADETVVVSSNFINYWVPSDYPVHLSCVTLTLMKTTVMILSFYNIENPFDSYAILEMVPDSSTVLLHSCFAEYKIGIICKSKFKYIPFGPRLTHPENPALKSSWWMLSCQKLNAFVAEKHIWIFIRPCLKSLPCPLDTPDGCNSTFFILVSICEYDWCMDICMQLWMSERTVSKSLWLTGILNEFWYYRCFTDWKLFVSLYIFVFLAFNKNVCLLFFFSSSLSLYPSMHKFTCCSNLQNVVKNVHCDQ